MFGFSWFQSKEIKKQQKAKQEALIQNQIKLQETALLNSAQGSLKQNDSIPAHYDISDYLDEETNQIIKEAIDTIMAHRNSADPVLTPKKEAEEKAPAQAFNDTYLNAAYNKPENAAFHTLSNDLVEIEFTNLGAQPYSVKLKNYTAYNPEDPDSPKELYFMPKEWSDYNVIFDLIPSVSDVHNKLNTKDFAFEIVDSTKTQIVMKLPFEGGYIQQKYWLDEGDYMVKNELTVEGISKLVPATSDEYETRWMFVVPRLEQGYTNEKRYSKLNYYYSGEKEPEVAAEGMDTQTRVTSPFEWFAVQQQFFSAIVTPEDAYQSAGFELRYFNEKQYETEGALIECDILLNSSINISEDKMTSKSDFYFGPNDYKTLKSYDRNYERIIPLGGWMVSWFNRWVIIPVFDFLGKFIDNYGIIILILTLLVKLILSPLTIRSYKSTAKMQALKPEIQQINEKYPKQEDAMKKQQAMMNLYQKAGVSPMGGCLPMLLQMPILFAMFRFFPASIQLRQEGFLWADDLSSYDSAIHFGANIPLLGDHISIFALLMALSMFVYSKMNSAQMGDGGMPGMKFMSLYLMPIMMFFICNSLPAALSYYYLLSNLVTMAMTWYIRKYVVTEEKVRAEMARAALKPRKKSKWQLRLEEAQRMQEQMQREKKNRRR